MGSAGGEGLRWPARWRWPKSAIRARFQLGFGRGARAQRGKLNYGSRRRFGGRDGMCDGEKWLCSSVLAPMGNAARNREGKRGKSEW